MVIKESGGVRLFPVLEKVFVASAYEIDGIDDGRYWEFASSQYWELYRTNKVA